LGNLRERAILEDLGIDRRMILRWTGSEMTGMEWIDVVQDRDRWGAVVNAVMNLQVA
jgi:hypothetical protein